MSNLWNVTATLADGRTATLEGVDARGRAEAALALARMVKEQAGVTEMTLAVPANANSGKDRGTRFYTYNATTDRVVPHGDAAPKAKGTMTLAAAPQPEPEPEPEAEPAKRGK